MASDPPRHDSTKEDHDHESFPSFSVGDFVSLYSASAGQHVVASVKRVWRDRASVEWKCGSTSYRKELHVASLTKLPSNQACHLDEKVPTGSSMRSHAQVRCASARSQSPCDRPQSIRGSGVASTEFALQHSGQYQLLASGGARLAGSYKFERTGANIGTLEFTTNGKLQRGGPPGTDGHAKFSWHPVGVRGDSLWKTSSTQSIPCVTVTDSEIMAEIQNVGNRGAYFVLPSQLNGAEYPSHNCVVRSIEDYKGDHTGGPRGQLSVHPAAGQFILDSAACDCRPNGINAVAEIICEARCAGFDFYLKNGYLKIPPMDVYNDSQRACEVFQKHLHSLRILKMDGIPACGLTSDKSNFSEHMHAVTLIYASSVPVMTYLNKGKDDQREFQERIAEMILTAQYYGALQQAASTGSSQTRVFLMPLGGGVFGNPAELITKSLSRAIECLSSEQRERLDIHLLTWSGKPKEKIEYTELLRTYGKLRLSQVTCAEGTRLAGSRKSERTGTSMGRREACSDGEGRIFWHDSTCTGSSCVHDEIDPKSVTPNDLATHLHGGVAGPFSEKPGIVTKDASGQVSFLAQLLLMPHFRQHCKQYEFVPGDSKLVWKYTSDGTWYKTVNLALAVDSGTCLRSLGKEVMSLRNAIEKGKGWHGTVYRGMTLSSDEVEHMKSLCNFYFPSFTSGSKDPNKAFKQNATLTIDIPPHIAALDVAASGLSKHDEAEVLLPCYTLFHLVKVEGSALKLKLRLLAISTELPWQSPSP